MKTAAEFYHSEYKSVPVNHLDYMKFAEAYAAHVLGAQVEVLARMVRYEQRVVVLEAEVKKVALDRDAWRMTAKTLGRSPYDAKFEGMQKGKGE